MPSRRRKNVKPPPSLSFVTLDFGAQGVNWLKIHSGAARRHAAYWGGPERHQYRREEDRGQQANITHISYADEVVGVIAKAPTLDRVARHEPPSHNESGSLQRLPPLPFEIRSTGSRLEVDPSTFEFLGEGFVKQFLMVDEKEYSLMFNGYLLLNYAYQMAYTGHGTRMRLLELKGQLIRCINENIKLSGGVLSPRCLTAILALGAPVVCLVSQDLPHGRTMYDYIFGSRQGEYLCCLPESADAGQRALDEQIVHRQPMQGLFSTSSASFQDPDSVALLQYLSNHMNLQVSFKSALRLSPDNTARSMNIESANHTTTPLEDIADLFPEAAPCEDCSIPAHWTSPLTCQWLDATASTPVEREMLLLASLMHRWLATFLDRTSNPLVPTEDLLEERASLRQLIEGFLPVAKNRNLEADARYECCRWASLILLAVDKLRIPIYAAAKHVRISPRLTHCLRMTDMAQLWGIRRGLLFWVTAVCHFATVGQCYNLLCTALLARFSQEFAMSHCVETAIKPLRRLKRFEKLCCQIPNLEDGSQLVIT